MVENESFLSKTYHFFLSIEPVSALLWSCCIFSFLLECILSIFSDLSTYIMKTFSQNMRLKDENTNFENFINDECNKISTDIPSTKISIISMWNRLRQKNSSDNHEMTTRQASMSPVQVMNPLYENIACEDLRVSSISFDDEEGRDVASYCSPTSRSQRLSRNSEEYSDMSGPDVNYRLKNSPFISARGGTETSSSASINPIWENQEVPIDNDHSVCVIKGKVVYLPG